MAKLEPETEHRYLLGRRGERCWIGGGDRRGDGPSTAAEEGGGWEGGREGG